MTALARAAELLCAARTPLLLVGSGARRAMDAVELLRSALQAPILTTPEAKSQVDERRLEAGGVFSFGASERANRLVAAADLVLTIGTELGEFASRGGRAFAGKEVVQIISDARDISCALLPQLIVLQDPAKACYALLRQLPPVVRQPWFDAVHAPSALRVAPAASREALQPGSAIAALQACLPPRARLACDVTSGTLQLLREMALGPEQRLWCNLEKSACMGGALAAGLGLRLASGLPTLVLIGDWGLMMGSSELHTAASLRLSAFVLLVWSNAGGALVRAGVKAQGIDVSEDLHTWQVPPDFVQIARGYRLSAVSVRTQAGLKRALRQGFSAVRPLLIEAIIEPHAEIPAADRYVHLDASMERAP